MIPEDYHLWYLRKFDVSGFILSRGCLDCSVIPDMNVNTNFIFFCSDSLAIVLWPSKISSHISMSFECELCCRSSVNVFGGRSSSKRYSFHLDEPNDGHSLHLRRDEVVWSVFRWFRSAHCYLFWLIYWISQVSKYDAIRKCLFINRIRTIYLYELTVLGWLAQPYHQ